MSTQNVAVPHPFDPDETLEGERVGTARRTDSPWPWTLVRIDGTDTTVRVPSETLADD